MNRVQAVWVVASAGLVWSAVFTVPRWLITSIHRGRLWDLRDRIFDDVRLGLFRGEEEKATALLEETERAIVSVPYFTLGNLRRIAKLLNGMSDAERRRLRRRARLNDQGSPRLLSYRARLNTVLGQQLLTGSWRGLLFTGRSLAREFIDRIVHRSSNLDDDLNVVSVPFRAVKVEVRRDSKFGEQVVNAEEYLPYVGRDDHDDVLAAV